MDQIRSEGRGLSMPGVGTHVRRRLLKQAERWQWSLKIPAHRPCSPVVDNRFPKPPMREKPSIRKELAQRTIRALKKRRFPRTLSGHHWT